MNKEFYFHHSILQTETSFIDFAHAHPLFLGHYGQDFKHKSVFHNSNNNNNNNNNNDNNNNNNNNNKQRNVAMQKGRCQTGRHQGRTEFGGFGSSRGLLVNIKG